jgi:hypothetical protein
MVETYKVYEKMKGNKVLLSYNGEVSFDMVKSLLDIIEGRFEREESNPKIKKKIFNVLVECLQNLCHHVEMSEDEVRDIAEGRNAVILLWVEDEFYHVGTGNYIANKNIKKLKDWLDKINGLSKDDLRGLYKQVLNNNQFSPKGGGGLGFIDIARKSGQKLQYDFEHVDDDFSFFSFRIQIPKD